MRLVEKAKSLFAAIRASAAWLRARRLARAAKQQTALSVALDGLDLLRKPYVDQAGALEGSALVLLTYFSERTAEAVGIHGPPLVDLEKAVVLLESIGSYSDAENKTVCVQAIYLKSRIGMRSAKAIDVTRRSI